MHERLHLWRAPAGAIAALTLGALIAGCGGSSNNSTPAQPAKGTASCTSGASPVSTTVPFAAGTTTFTSPTVGGCSASFTLANLTSSGTATITTQLTAPAGLATPPATGNNSPPTGFSLPFTAVFYATITFNNAVTQASSGNPALTITVANLVPGSPGGNFFNASWLTATGTANVFQGYTGNCNTGASVPLTASGNTLSAAAQTCSGSGGSVPAGSTLTAALVYF